MNLLLFKVNQLGDNVVFVPVVQQLKRMFPQTRITIFTTPAAAPLYRGPLGAQRIVTAERSEFNDSWRNPLALSRFWLAARTARARAALVSGDQGSVAHLLSLATVNSIRVGSAELNIRGPNGITHAVRCPPGAKIATWNWEMGRALAAALGRYDWPLAVAAPELTHLAAPRGSGRPCVVIHAGSSKDYRRWPLENFAELAHRLASDFEVVWIDRPDTRGLPHPPEEKIVPSDSLAELASWIARADLFIGNHSGPFQLAAALSRPSVILSGPTHFEWDPPWHGEKIQILRATGLPCLPCEKHNVVPGECTHASAPMACMKSWSVDEVEKRCREWMQRWLKTSPS
jgi:ADP-heptose:LPS heptosyltransferase